VLRLEIESFRQLRLRLPRVLRDLEMERRQAQAAVNADSQVIVAQDLTACARDANQMAPILAQIKEKMALPGFVWPISSGFPRPRARNASWNLSPTT